MLLCQSSLTRLPVIQVCFRISLRSGHNSTPPILTRFLSSNTKISNDFPSTHEILTLLQKATTLLPRALDIKGTSSSTREGSVDFWNTILSSVHGDLLATTERPAKIVGPCTPIVSFRRSIDYLFLFQYVV